MLCALLAAATIALYVPALSNRFLVLDDRDYVTGNSHVQDGLSWSTLKWAFTSLHAANWHPLTWLSHAFDYELFGLNPLAHHLDNVLLHAINAVLLFLLLVWMTKRTGPSLLVAALFAVHPLNVESVAWIAERKNVLSTMFFFLTIGAYVWYTRKRDWQHYLLVVLLFAAGLTAKPMLVTLPFVLLLLDYWPLGRMPDSPASAIDVPRANWLRLVLEKLPLLALSAASSWATLRAQRPAVRNFAEFGLAVRVENATAAYLLYLWKALWPSRLSVLYPHPSGLLPTSQLSLSAFILVGITILVLVFRRKAYLPVGWFWFLGTLIPVIGLVQVGDAALADRYAYLTLVGIFVMIAWTLDDWADSKRIPTVWRVIPALAIVIALACVTSRQIGYWESDYSLWSHAVAVSAKNPEAQESLADALVYPEGAMSAKDLQDFDTEQKRIDAARQHSEAALQIYQQLAQQNPDAYRGKEAGVLNNLGNEARLQNRIDQAGREFDQAFQMYIPLAQQNSEVYRPALAMTLSNLGSVATLQNRPSEAYDREEAALSMYRQLAQEDADRYQQGVVTAQKNLAFLAQTANTSGNAAVQSHRLNDARANYDEALKIWRQLTVDGAADYLPEMVNTLVGLGFLERSEKRPDRAGAYFEEATQIDRQLAQKNPQKYLPDLAIRQLNLGNFYTEQNQLESARTNYEAAVQSYRQLVQQSPDKYSADLAGTLSNLALVDQLEKRYTDSRSNYTEALAIYRKLAQGNGSNYANNVMQVETSLRQLGNKATLQ